jgi:hypothetical protein
LCLSADFGINGAKTSGSVVRLITYFLPSLLDPSIYTEKGNVTQVSGYHSNELLHETKLCTSSKSRMSEKCVVSVYHVCCVNTDIFIWICKIYCTILWCVYPLLGNGLETVSVFVVADSY